LVGSSVILAAAIKGWEPGVDIAAKTFAQFAILAHNMDAAKFLNYGVREFLIEFDGCIRSGRRSESVARTIVLFCTHSAIIKTEDSRSIGYFLTVIAGYYEGYTGATDEEQLFGDANKACADKLGAISKGRDSDRLRLFLSAILQFAGKCSKDRGKDQFLSMIPGSCLILCQQNYAVHQWLFDQAIPESMDVLILQQPRAIQKRAFEALVECLIVGKQYGLVKPAVLQQIIDRTSTVSEHVSDMPDQSLSRSC
jgi:hypothetical protein